MSSTPTQYSEANEKAMLVRIVNLCIFPAKLSAAGQALPADKLYEIIRMHVVDDGGHVIEDNDGNFDVVTSFSLPAAGRVNIKLWKIMKAAPASGAPGHIPLPDTLKIDNPAPIEENILKMINDKTTSILSGDTGAGKTEWKIEKMLVHQRVLPFFVAALKGLESVA